jgi:hypothetical protein
MVELICNGRVVGVFTSENSAKDWADKVLKDSSYSIVPLGTVLFTDEVD